MNPKTNKKKVQILKWFTDHRRNRIAPGIYEPGTMLLDTINKLRPDQYVYIDDDKQVVPKKKQAVINENTTVVKKLVQTVNATKEEPPVVNTDLKSATRGRKTNTTPKKDAPSSSVSK